MCNILVKHLFQFFNFFVFAQWMYHVKCECIMSNKRHRGFIIVRTFQNFMSLYFLWFEKYMKALICFVIWLNETLCCIHITWCLGNHDMPISANHHGETQYLDSSVHLIPLCLRQRCFPLISLQMSFHLAQIVTIVYFLANACDDATN